jgi:hypothetical protein
MYVPRSTCEPQGPQFHKAGTVVVAFIQQYVYPPPGSRAKEVPKTSEPSLSTTSDPRKGQSFYPCAPWSELLSLTTLLILLGLGWGHSPVQGHIHCLDPVERQWWIGPGDTEHRSPTLQTSHPSLVLRAVMCPDPHNGFVVTETAVSSYARQTL